MFWRGIIVGVALAVSIASLALVAFYSNNDSAAPCPATTCCGSCGQDRHAHQPPVKTVWAPPGPLRYYCGLSDHGGGFVWDHGGGYIWDHGGGYLWDHGGGSLWDHGGGFVWDHGGGYIWDHGGGYIWDQGGGFIWNSDLDPGPVPGGPVVPVPDATELGIADGRKPFEFRCITGAGGINDVAVVMDDIPVSIVMPDGNEDFECAISDNGGAEVIVRTPSESGALYSPDRAYCMVVNGNTFESLDPAWAE